MKTGRLFSPHSIGTRIVALFMLLILVITAAMTYVSINASTNELLVPTSSLPEITPSDAGSPLTYSRRTISSALQITPREAAWEAASGYWTQVPILWRS